MQPEESHRNTALSKLSSLGQKFFKYIEFDADEELVLEIRKHPFGLVLIEVSGFFISAIMVGVLIGLSLLLDDLGLVQDPGLLSTLQPVLILVALLLGLLGIGATFLAGWVYRNNVIFVTTEKIAQVLYANLIDRKVSQLSIGDVQDVTVSQKGLFSRLFRYGTLVIETAGEQQNYTFTYVPNPYESSQVIVGSHEKNLRAFGN